jgi:exonuclease SbcC
VSERFAGSARPDVMTVGGSRIEGTPALGGEAARFYTERCYLDQVSLGQLLELYQYREGKEESALARFVNELLGLEQLDALRSGLSDANDWRRLKRLSEPLAEAEAQAEQAASDLSRASADLTSAQAEIARSRSRLTEALQTMHLEMPAAEDHEVGQRVTDLLRSASPGAAHAAASALNGLLTKLGGRIEGLSSYPSVKRSQEAQAEFLQATQRYEAWRAHHADAVEAWRSDAEQLRTGATSDWADELGAELQRIVEAVTRQDALVAAARRLEAQAATDGEALRRIEASLAGALERAGSLVEGLSALRDHASSNICPVCDRDFSEVSSTHLTVHMDGKIAELTSQGARLRALRDQRDSLAAELLRTERQLEETHLETWTDEQRSDIETRKNELEELRERLEALQPAMDEGAKLQAEVANAAARQEQLEALAHETSIVNVELARIAKALGANEPDPGEPLQAVWGQLADLAAGQLARAETMIQAHTAAEGDVERLRLLNAEMSQAKEKIAQAAERKLLWDSRLSEARRRQAVAKAVLNASTTARADIIQRVFTDSLNHVWRDVFTRLAPREPFVPAFGVPSSGRSGLELTLETIHRSGAPGGSPQMMLSAGNLNTAALSLFIALHLAVEPLVPCLVLDDPVQSMDEVHIAQFAALIRVLSKHHKRQVIIAVHERELFQYLALELSPAYAGDELLTIELGDRLNDEDGGITRAKWSPDSAIAV